MEYNVPGYRMCLNSQQSHSRKDKAAISALVENWLFFHILLYFRFTLSAGLRSQLCCVGKVEKGFKNKNVYSAEFCFHAFLLTTKKLSTVAYLRLNNQR